MESLSKESLFIVLTAFLFQTMAHKRVCYYSNWAQYRSDPMKFTPDNIDPFLCTHIMYAFGKVSGNNIAMVEWNDGVMYQKIVALTAINSNLKLMLAIGGWTHGVQSFSTLVSNHDNMGIFANNSVAFLRQHGFHGLDLDWEYPGRYPSPASDQQRFTALCKILREVYEKEAISSGKPRLLLSAAVAAGKQTVDSAYEIAEISSHLDFINLMSYDFHGSWESIAGHNSPLYGRPGEIGNNIYMNQNFSIHYWIQNGTPREKLVMGLGLYGRSFTLANSKNSGMGEATVGAGNPDTYTEEAGYMAYFEICKHILDDGWTREWHADHMVPYAYRGNQWVGYDDLKSFEIKAHYIKDNRLGGAMVWALDLDDFKGICNNGVFPMMNLLKNVLGSNTETGTSIQPDVTSSVTLESSSATRPSSIILTTTSLSTDDTATSSIFPKTTQNSCAPAICPIGKVVGDVCDQACYHECCQDTTVKGCCSVGFVWDNAEQNCKTIVPSITSTMIPVTTEVNCDAPTTCVHGEFIADPCNLDWYYECGHGIPYYYQCAPGSLWDSFIKACNHPDLIQYDPACHPVTCPDGTFYPDICESRCYYQCSSGIGYRYCCPVGHLWDTSIDNCNLANLVANPFSLRTTSDVATPTSSLNTNSGHGQQIIVYNVTFTGCENRPGLNAETAPTAVASTVTDLSETTLRLQDRNAIEKLTTQAGGDISISSQHAPISTTNIGIRQDTIAEEIVTVTDTNDGSGDISVDTTQLEITKPTTEPSGKISISSQYPSMSTNEVSVTQDTSTNEIGMVTDTSDGSGDISIDTTPLEIFNTANSKTDRPTKPTTESQNGISTSSQYTSMSTNEVGVAQDTTTEEIGMVTDSTDGSGDISVDTTQLEITKPTTEPPGKISISSQYTSMSTNKVSVAQDTSIDEIGMVTDMSDGSGDISVDTTPLEITKPTTESQDDISISSQYTSMSTNKVSVAQDTTTEEIGMVTDTTDGSGDISVDTTPLEFSNTANSKTDRPINPTTESRKYISTTSQYPSMYTNEVGVAQDITTEEIDMVTDTTDGSGDISVDTTPLEIAKPTTESQDDISTSSQYPSMSTNEVDVGQDTTTEEIDMVTDTTDGSGDISVDTTPLEFSTTTNSVTGRTINPATVTPGEISISSQYTSMSTNKVSVAQDTSTDEIGMVTDTSDGSGEISVDTTPLEFSNTANSKTERPTKPTIESQNGISTSSQYTSMSTNDEGVAQDTTTEEIDMVTNTTDGSGEISVDTTPLEFSTTTNSVTGIAINPATVTPGEISISSQYTSMSTNNVSVAQDTSTDEIGMVTDTTVGSGQTSVHSTTEVNISDGTAADYNITDQTGKATMRASTGVTSETSSYTNSEVLSSTVIMETSSSTTDMNNITDKTTAINSISTTQFTTLSMPTTELSSTEPDSSESESVNVINCMPGSGVCVIQVDSLGSKGTKHFTHWTRVSILGFVITFTYLKNWTSMMS